MAKDRPKKDTHPRIPLGSCNPSGETTGELGSPGQSSNGTPASGPVGPERPLDASQIGDVPQLIPIRALGFDRVVMVCPGSTGRDAAIRLAGLLCSGLRDLPLEDRSGVAYIQIDEPLGADRNVFQGNVFFPSDSIVSCITGTRALANSICVGAMKASGNSATGAGRFPHRLNSLPVWAIVQDDSVLLTEAYFAGMQPALRAAGWRVWTLDVDVFSAAWGSEAENLLAALPEEIPKLTGNSRQSASAAKDGRRVGPSRRRGATFTSGALARAAARRRAAGKGR